MPSMMPFADRRNRNGLVASLVLIIICNYIKAKVHNFG